MPSTKNVTNLLKGKWNQFNSFRSAVNYNLLELTYAILKCPTQATFAANSLHFHLSFNKIL